MRRDIATSSSEIEEMARESWRRGSLRLDMWEGTSLRLRGMNELQQDAGTDPLESQSPVDGALTGSGPSTVHVGKIPTALRLYKI